MSNRAEDPKALFRQFIQTLSQIPPTTPASQLDKLTKLQRVLEKEENLVTEADVVKRERLVKEYEDELRKSSKQSQSVSFVDIMSDRFGSTLSSKWTSVNLCPCDSGSWDKPVQSCNT